MEWIPDKSPMKKVIEGLEDDRRYLRARAEEIAESARQQVGALLTEANQHMTMLAERLTLEQSKANEALRTQMAKSHEQFAGAERKLDAMSSLTSAGAQTAVGAADRAHIAATQADSMRAYIESWHQNYNQRAERLLEELPQRAIHSVRSVTTDLELRVAALQDELRRSRLMMWTAVVLGVVLGVLLP